MTQRQSKFRAWDGKNMREPGPNMMLDSFGGHVFWQFAFNAPEPTGWKPLFWTGLTDKNGEEIYEGDVVIVDQAVDRGDGHYDDEMGVIVFNNAAFGLKADSVGWDFITEGEDADFTVIGNIYENPELIGGET